MAESTDARVASEACETVGARSRRARLVSLGVGMTGLGLLAAAFLTTGIAVGQEGYPEPGVFASQDGVLDTSLTVSREAVDIAGTPVVATVYNGSFLGPTMQVQPGDRIELSLQNNLAEATNIHFHGLHVSPSGNSDNIFLEIPAGAAQDYVVQLPENHPSGTFWYHSHIHHTTEEQVFGGLSGLVVVDGLTEKLPAELQDIEQRTIALKDFQAKDGAILTENIDSNAPTTRTVNGAVNPSISIDAGGTQLWRLANIGADIFYEVQLDGHEFSVLAEDGNPVWQVAAHDSLVMPPGKRFDVLVQGGEPGTYNLKTLAYDQGGDQYPETTLATVTVNASSQTPAQLPETMVEPYDLSTATVDKTRTVTFSKDEAKQIFMIDGQQFDANRVDQTVQLGTVEEWTIRNTDPEQHPFHIHVNDFQVMSVNGVPYDAVNHQDVVILPPQGEVIVRMPFEDFTGKFVYHCHILNHEDNGMMAVIEVVE